MGPKSDSFHNVDMDLLPNFWAKDLSNLIPSKFGTNIISHCVHNDIVIKPAEGGGGGFLALSASKSYAA